MRSSCIIVCRSGLIFERSDEMGNQSKELWDAYNPDGTKAGFDRVRGEPIPDGYWAYQCIGDMCEHSPVSEEEKQRLFTKLDCYVPRPSGLLMTRGILWMLALLCGFHTLRLIVLDHFGVLLWIEYAVFLILIVALIGVRFLTKVNPYLEWREVRGQLLKNEVYKTPVTPLGVSRSRGIFKKCYIRFADGRGVCFYDTYPIAEELYEQIESKKICAYFYKEKKRGDRYYGLFRIYITEDC